MNTKWKRKLRAQLRDARVLFNESKSSLFLFIVLLMGGAFILRSTYAHPETGASPEYLQAVYSIFTMIFFATDLPFPQIWYLQIFFFLVPILGLLVIADARRTRTLLDANVDKADAIIPCTADELANLDIALEAREIKKDIKVVMRMFDADLARRVERGFGIHTAFSTSMLSAPIFAAAAMRLDIKHSFYLGDSLLNLSELVVQPGSKLIGRTVEMLEQEMELSVVCYQHGELADLHPMPDLQVKESVKLILLAKLDTLQQLKKLNEGQDR